MRYPSSYIHSRGLKAFTTSDFQRWRECLKYVGNIQDPVFATNEAHR